jgi:flavin reductase (DIM6/NTAB) family NADH-FMN oxidoreductase RutF
MERPDMQRHELPFASMSTGAGYALLTSVVVPRPIAWVITRSASGTVNLAPHSFFTVASHAPPVIQFTSVGAKDTLRNARETGELVVHLSPEWLIDEVNLTGVNAPPDVSEVELAGLETEPSVAVACPRLVASPVALECTLERLVEVGACTLVLARVVHASVDEAALDLSDPERPYADIRRLRPLARLGRDEWSTIGEIVTRKRPVWGRDLGP